MKKVVVQEKGRKKAFIGAIIGTVAGIAGDLIGAKKRKKAEEEAFNNAQNEQYRVDGVKQAAAITSSYANQDYVRQFNDKVTLKGGGKVKISDSKDRLTRSKKYAMGGTKRKKYENGGDDQIDFGAEAGAALGGVSGLVSNIFSKPSVPKMVKKADGFTYDGKVNLTPASYKLDANGNPVTNVNAIPPVDPSLITRTNTSYADRIPQAKFGKSTKRAKKSGL